MSKQHVPRKPSNVEKVVYNVPEIAVMLDIDLTKAYQLAKREDFPAIRVGAKRVIIPKAAFHRWLESAAVTE